MDKIEVWMASIPNTLTFEDLKAFIIDKAGPVNVIDAQFRPLNRGNLFYAFVHMENLDDAVKVVEALRSKTMLGVEYLTVRLAQPYHVYAQQKNLNSNLESPRERKPEIRYNSRLDRNKSDWTLAEGMQDRWANFSGSDSKSSICARRKGTSFHSASEISLTSSSREPIPSRPENFQLEPVRLSPRLSPPPPTFSLSQSNFQLPSDSTDYSHLLNTFQDPPRLPYSQEELDLWIEYSWYGRLPYDCNIRREPGYFDKVRKIIPPNWRMIPCTKFPPALGQTEFCWGRLCNFAHGPFELRKAINKLSYPGTSNEEGWTSLTNPALQTGNPTLPSRDPSPLLTDRYALTNRSTSKEDSTQRSQNHQNQNNYGSERSTKRQKLTRTWSKIDNIDPFEFEEFALPIITPPFSSFKRSATSNITLGYLSSPQASFALSVIQPCSEKTNFNKQYESFLKSCLDPQDREFYFEGLNIIEDYSKRNLDFMELANRIVEKDETNDWKKSSRR